MSMDAVIGWWLMAVGGECLAGLPWFAHPPTKGVTLI